MLITYNLLLDLRRTHSIILLQKIKIVGEPLNLFELASLKRLYGVTIKYQPLEENVLTLPESKQEESKMEEIKDEETLELLNKIRHITKSWSENQKEDIENKIYILTREYRQKLEDTKNNFNLDETLELTPVSPSMIREGFIIKLESLYRSIYQNKYNDLLMKIDDYETWLKNDIKPTVPNEIISVEDKIKFIIFNSFTSEKRYLGILEIILSNTKQKISNISPSTIDNTPLLVLEDIDTKFETEISNLYLEVSRRKEIEETLKGKNQTELGKDIKALLNIINEFSKNDKEWSLKELSNIIQKYFNILLGDKTIKLDTIELDLIRELLPFMAKIITIKPVPSLNKVKELIDKCLDVLEQNNNVEAKDNILLETIIEINSLINYENLNETEKEKMTESIKKILFNWKSKIETEEDECLNYLNEPDMLVKSLKQDENEIKVQERIILEDKNLQIELLILSELLALKGKIEEKINRNIECLKLLKSL